MIINNKDFVDERKRRFAGCFVFLKSGLMLILAAFLTTFYFMSDFQKDEKDHVQIPHSVRWKIGIFYSNCSLTRALFSLDQKIVNGLFLYFEVITFPFFDKLQDRNLIFRWRHQTK